MKFLEETGDLAPRDGRAPRLRIDEASFDADACLPSFAFSVHFE